MIKVTYTENTDINVDFTSVQSLKIRYTAIERIVDTTAIPTHFNTVFKNFDRLGFITLILLLLLIGFMYLFPRNRILRIRIG